MKERKRVKLAKERIIIKDNEFRYLRAGFIAPARGLNSEQKTA
jgi:hypothetical protein